MRSWPRRRRNFPKHREPKNPLKKEEEAELLEIEAEDFARLLERNPDIGEVIADLASTRNKENQELLAKIKEFSASDIEESTNKNSILARLKNLVNRLA